MVQFQSGHLREVQKLRTLRTMSDKLSWDLEGPTLMSDLP